MGAKLFNREPDLEERFQEIRELLSEVTGQPVITEMSPEKFDGKLQDRLSFRFDMMLGDEYHINMWEVLERDYHFNRNSWSEEDCGYELKDKDGNLIGRKAYSSTAGFFLDDFQRDPNTVDKTRLQFLLSNFGGIDVHNPCFMDYERFTLESLDKDDSYFDCIYLRIMCDLKEKGVELPPILSKEEAIYVPMFEGDIDAVRLALDEMLTHVEQNYSSASLFHARAEAKQIRQLVTQKGFYHNPLVPLIDKVPYIPSRTIPGEVPEKTYNILVVEDFDREPMLYGEEGTGTINKLSALIADQMASNPAYAGTNVFNTFAIADCLTLCATGQIDAIVMDEGNFALGEAMRLMPMAAPGASIGVYTDGEKTDIDIGMDDRGEKQSWRNMMYKEFEKKDLPPPPCMIYKNPMQQNIIAFLDHALLNQHSDF